MYTRNLAKLTPPSAPNARDLGAGKTFSLQISRTPETQHGRRSLARMIRIPARAQNALRSRRLSEKPSSYTRDLMSPEPAVPHRATRGRGPGRRAGGAGRRHEDVDTRARETRVRDERARHERGVGARKGEGHDHESLVYKLILDMDMGHGNSSTSQAQATRLQQNNVTSTSTRQS